MITMISPFQNGRTCSKEEAEEFLRGLASRTCLSDLRLAPTLADLMYRVMPNSTKKLASKYYKLPSGLTVITKSPEGPTMTTTLTAPKKVTFSNMERGGPLKEEEGLVTNSPMSWRPSKRARTGNISQSPSQPSQQDIPISSENVFTSIPKTSCLKKCVCHSAAPYSGDGRRGYYRRFVEIRVPGRSYGTGRRMGTWGRAG